MENKWKKEQEAQKAQDYKKRIIEMVEEIENPDYLFKIFHYILAKHRRENNNEETG